MELAHSVAPAPVLSADAIALWASPAVTSVDEAIVCQVVQRGRIVATVVGVVEADGADGTLLASRWLGRVVVALKPAILELAACQGARSASGLTIDAEAHRAFVGGNPLELSPREYQIAAMLLDQAGRVVPREQITAAIWGLDDASTRKALDVHLVRLRRKLQASGSGGPNITTLRGVGLRLETGED